VILNIEEPLLIQLVRLATQGAANNLLAEELRAKGANAEHVGDGVGIPPFGQHGDRDHATDRLAKPSLFANRVHHLTQQILIGKVFSLSAIVGSLNNFAAEPLNLVARHLPKVFIERLARLKLLAVDQQRSRLGERGAIITEIPEERKPTVFKLFGAIRLLTIKSGESWLSA